MTGTQDITMGNIGDRAFGLRLEGKLLGIAWECYLSF